MRTNHTRLAAAAAALCATTLLGACGDDDATAGTVPPAADTTEAPVEAPADTIAAPVETTEAPVATTVPSGGTASAEFCDAFVAIEKALPKAPDDPAERKGYFAEEVNPNLEIVRANLPEEVADEVSVMLAAVDEVAPTGDLSVFETPEFGAAASKVYPFLEEGCGMPAVKVLAVDFSFGGIPAELEIGPTVFTLTNNSETGEMHEMGLVKLKDGVDQPLEELLAMPERKVDKLIDTFGGGLFAMPEATSGTVVELTPGRWIYACFIPVGSIDGAEGKGKPHFMEGMSGEFVVS